MFGITKRWTCEVRAVPVALRSGLTVCAALPASIKPEAMVFMDNHLAYRLIDKMPDAHQSVKHREKEFTRKCVHKGHRKVWSLLERSFKGVYHHLSAKRCRCHISDLTFRFEQGEQSRRCSRFTWCAARRPRSARLCALRLLDRDFGDERTP
ncbi:MAG: transposase [Ectothiorhodospiraceae bacterium AqS1]|nr:transposase [Ectothiorhodospiraceae bacterium AqS1]